MSANVLADERVKWIRQKVSLALEMPSEQFDSHFIETAERSRDAIVAREQISEFLTSKHGAGSSIFFSCKKWSEEIEGMNFKVLIVVIFCFAESRS